MSESNLFIRLEGYARENFTTETLAYILQTDGKVRRKFLELLLSERKEMLAAFRDCEITTQCSLDVGRPDLQITSKRDNAQKIFVEVKTRSPEGKQQSQKYLSRGHLAYLTPLGFDGPSLENKNDDRFLGHFFWHKIHAVIKSASPQNVLHKQFLEYLEKRHMGPPEPITKKELKAAADAVGFLGKSQAIVDDVRKQIENEWKKQFGKNVGARQVCSDLIGRWLHCWWYRTKKWRKKGRSFYLCIGTGLDAQRKPEPMFYLSLGSTRKKFWPVLDSDLSKQLRELRKRGWEKADASDDEWYYYKCFPIGPGDIDRAARKQADNVRQAMKDLRHLKIITMIENRM